MSDYPKPIYKDVIALASLIVPPCLRNKSPQFPCTVPRWRTSEWAYGESFWQIAVILISYVVVVGSPSRVTRSFCFQVLKDFFYLISYLQGGFPSAEVVA